MRIVRLWLFVIVCAGGALAGCADDDFGQDLGGVSDLSGVSDMAVGGDVEN